MWLSLGEFPGRRGRSRQGMAFGNVWGMDTYSSLHQFGHLLADREVRVSVGLRFGEKLVSQHTYVCDSRVQPDGHHGLSCRRNAGHQSRHHALNTILALTLCSVDVSAMLMPAGFIRGDGNGQMA